MIQWTPAASTVKGNPMLLSLLSFHRALILAAIIFCLGYGSWEIMRGSFLFGSLFVGFGLGFAVYLARLRQFLGYLEG